MFRPIFGPGSPWVLTSNLLDPPMQFVASWRGSVSRSVISTNISAGAASAGPRVTNSGLRRGMLEGRRHEFLL